MSWCLAPDGNSSCNQVEVDPPPFLVLGRAWSRNRWSGCGPSRCHGGNNGRVSRQRGPCRRLPAQHFDTLREVVPTQLILQTTKKRLIRQCSRLFGRGTFPDPRLH